MTARTTSTNVPDYLEKTLKALFNQLNKAEQQAVGKRKIRRLKRQIDFCNAYLHLLQECLPVITSFHTQPVYIINRFWTEFNTWNNFCNSIYPSRNDFFTWYFDSATIEEEIREN